MYIYIICIHIFSPQVHVWHSAINKILKRHGELGDIWRSPSPRCLQFQHLLQEKRSKLGGILVALDTALQSQNVVHRSKSFVTSRHWIQQTVLKRYASNLQILHSHNLVFIESTCSSGVTTGLTGTSCMALPKWRKELLAAAAAECFKHHEWLWVRQKSVRGSNYFNISDPKNHGSGKFQH